MMVERRFKVEVVQTWECEEVEVDDVDTLSFDEWLMSNGTRLTERQEYIDNDGLTLEVVQP